MIRVEKLTPEQWASFSEHAHKVAFEKVKPAHFDRIDGAYLAINEVDDVPMGYVTFREHDPDTVYWQFGGAFPGTRGTPLTLRFVSRFLDTAKAQYKRVTFLVENTNIPMLKLALKTGFKITGVRIRGGSVLVEHLLEFQGA